MPVSNTFMRPEDGWQAVVTDPAFIRITAYPSTHPFYVYKGSIAPTTDTGGLLYQHPYTENVTDTDTFYVRIVSPAPDGSVRIDTFWISGSVAPKSHLSLEDGSGSLALEDGSGLLALEV